MTLLAFDRAAMFTAAELDGLKRAGAVAVCVYIVGTPGGCPHADKPYVDLIHSKGLGVVPNWERGAAYLVSCGRAGGTQAGLEAVAACQALGIPSDGTVAVPFSWDTHVDPSLYAQCGVVADAIIAALNGRYLFSAYGQGGLIDYFVRTGRMKPGVEGWLSMSRSFPGFNAGDPNVAMVQEHHADGTWFSSPVVGTDVDTITDLAGLHAWWPAGHGVDAISATQEEIVTPEDIKAIAAAVLAAPVGKDTGSLAQTVHDARVIARRAELAASQAVSGQAALVAALAAVQPGTVDLAAITKAAQDGAKAALDGYALHLDPPAAP